MKRPLTAAGSEPAGEREQPAADGAGRADRLIGQADEDAPAYEVVRDAANHRPGGVGVEPAGWEVRQRLVFEVANRELDDGVVAVFSLDLPPTVRCGWW
jgi:hypothetical protein